MFVRNIVEAYLCFITSRMFGPNNFFCRNFEDGDLVDEIIALDESEAERGCPSFSTPPPLPGKKGAAFALREIGEPGSWKDNLPKVLALNPHWSYSWSHTKIPQHPDHIEFIPMIWGRWNIPAKVEYVRDLVETGQANYVLGFNEPDRKDQAAMSVDLALDLWPELESIGAPLVSPSCEKPLGPWMEQFLGNATKFCKRVDWVGVHWYGGPNFASFRQAMVNTFELHDRRPILITEFAPADWSADESQENRHTEEEVLRFMKRALPWLESQDWIKGYAWFSFGQDVPHGGSSALFDSRGNLTACGRYYASVRNEKPSGDQSIST